MNKYKFAKKMVRFLMEEYDIEIFLSEDAPCSHTTFVYKDNEYVTALAADKYFDMYKGIKKYAIFAKHIVAGSIVRDIRDQRYEYEKFYNEIKKFQDILDSYLRNHDMENYIASIDNYIPYFAIFNLYKDGDYTIKHIWKKITKKITKEAKVR